MTKVKQNLVVIMGPAETPWDISSKSGHKLINRFCIDEDVASEISVVVRFRDDERKEKSDLVKKFIQKVSKNEDKQLKTHFVFTGDYYFFNENELRSSILEGIKRHKIKSIMVTWLWMSRNNLITKELMENFCKGKYKITNSVNDDLESFLEDQLVENEPGEILHRTYFFPKLTKEELKLVERKDSSYLETFRNPNPDVKKTEMELSESDSKFVHGWGFRKTFKIKNSLSL